MASRTQRRRVEYVVYNLARPADYWCGPFKTIGAARLALATHSKPGLRLSLGRTTFELLGRPTRG